jgi:hypothetical protein
MNLTLVESLLIEKAVTTITTTDSMTVISPHFVQTQDHPSFTSTILQATTATTAAANLVGSDWKRSSQQSYSRVARHVSPMMRMNLLWQSCPEMTAAMPADSAGIP